MNYRINFYIGIGQDRDGVAITEPDLCLALANIRGVVAAEFGGYTETAAQGGWKNDAGELVLEPSIMLSTVTDRSNVEYRATKLAGYMARQLNQSAVMVTIEPLQTVAFIGQEQRYEQA